MKSKKVWQVKPALDNWFENSKPMSEDQLKANYVAPEVLAPPIVKHIVLNEPGSEPPPPARRKLAKQPKSKQPPKIPADLLAIAQSMPKLKGLSIVQPFAELIMLGQKKSEFRTIRTTIRGQIYIYASGRRIDEEGRRNAVRKYRIEFDIDSLPRSVVVGTVELVDCKQLAQSEFEWILANPQRLPQPLPPLEKAQPVWFHPFGSPD